MKKYVRLPTLYLYGAELLNYKVGETLAVILGDQKPCAENTAGCAILTGDIDENFEVSLEVFIQDSYLDSIKNLYIACGWFTHTPGHGPVIKCLRIYESEYIKRYNMTHMSKNISELIARNNLEDFLK